MHLMNVAQCAKDKVDAATIKLENVYKQVSVKPFYCISFSAFLKYTITFFRPSNCPIYWISMPFVFFTHLILIDV